MNHLVVGDGQDEVLTPGIGDGEGQFVVDAPPEQGVCFEIFQAVIHPAHVPFEVEPQSADGRRHGDQGPGSGLLGDHQDTREFGQDRLVQFLQEADRLQVLPSAILVGPPFSVFPAVVQIEHGGYSIHPDSVRVIDVAPEGRAGEQKTAYFVPAEVKSMGSPFFVFPAQGIRILIEEVSVKFDEPESILGEMGRNPVQNDPDAVLMRLVDEIYEICRFTEPGSYGKIPGALITPGSIKGVFHDRKHFHMSISHVLHIGNQLIGSLPVGEIAAVIMPLPGPQMNFIDIHGRSVGVHGRPVFEIFIVRPKAGHVRVCQPGSHLPDFILLGRLRRKTIRIGLIDQAAVLCCDGILVAVTAASIFTDAFPDLGIVCQRMQRGAARIPIIEITCNSHSLCVRRPDTEQVTSRVCRVRSKQFIAPAGLALMEQVFRIRDVV